VIYDLAANDPDGLAVDDGLRRRTWAELCDRSARLARFLREDAGLRPDDHVAVLLENRVEYVELILGAIMAGVWITPINWHLSRGEIAYVVGDSGSRLVVSDPGHAAIARDAADRSGGAQVLLAGAELDAAIAGASDRPMDPDGPAGGNMIYTSGTTGRPKGVKRARPETLGAGLANLGALGRNVGLDGRGPHLITGPMYHASPLMFAVYDNANGAPIVILPHWDEARALALIQEREIAHTHLVPTMFVRLLRLPAALRERFRAPNLDLVLHGAAPVSVSVKRRMIEWWGEVFVEYWGATEAGVNTLVDSADWLAHPGTVGRALPAFEVFTVGADGRRLPPGETGDLYCRHKTVDRVFEYHGDPEKTARAYLEPGVFTIGDIGRVDADGYVYLADRKSSTIISGGVNIYPAEVEHVLQEHPAVADVAVFGIPDNEWGESVKAAVELAPGFAGSPQLQSEILEFARPRLARYKLPRSIDFEDELPRHPTGKLYTRLLRDRYWRGREKKI
jgi:long-chain acyl-CoA synthetase